MVWGDAGVRSIRQAPGQRRQRLQQARGLTLKQRRCVPEGALTTQLVPHRQVGSSLAHLQKEVGRQTLEGGVCVPTHLPHAVQL